ncbi:MAG: histidine phosphatase family protein, partial [Hyphomicrobium sp.]
MTFVANASTPAVRAAAFPLDEGLDQRGQQDAEALGKELPRASAVLVSSSRRAKETAAALGLTAEVDEGLRDLDLGRWAGFSIN